jgi:hypothetical protein
MFLKRVINKRFYFNARAFSENKQPSGQTIEINNPDDAQQGKGTHKPQANESLKAISEYKDALSYFQQGKYRISDELFKRVLGILEQTNQQNTENYNHILKK